MATTITTTMTMMTTKMSMSTIITTMAMTKSADAAITITMMMTMMSTSITITMTASVDAATTITTDHDADEVFTSWGLETNRTITKEKLESLLQELAHSEKYGQVLRAKGMLPDADGTWYYFDLVPEETEIRTGAPIYTGKVCVIGSNLKEDELKAAFEA